MFNQAVGIEMRNIPYKGGAPAVNAAVAGDVPIVIVDSAAANAQIRAGRLRVLAVTSAQRTPLVPDAPTVAESGVPGYDIAVWAGLFAPAGTPAAIVSRLYQEALRAMNAPDTKEKLKGIGMDRAEWRPSSSPRWSRRTSRNTARSSRRRTSSKAGPPKGAGYFRA